jgi:hypothetical protein
MFMLDTLREYTRKLLHRGANVYWEYKPLWTPRRLTTSLSDVPINRPIFLVGVQGAGLTLMTRMLHRNERVVTIGGGRAFWTGLNEMDKHCIRPLPNELTLSSPGFQAPTFKDHIGRCGEKHDVFGLERCWIYATDEMIDQYRKTEGDWDSRIESTMKKRIKESLRAYADDLQRARFLDMSQTFSLKLPLLHTIFPDAKIVVQTRDPYVMCWREATGEHGFWNREPPLQRRLKLAAQHWRNTYRTLLEDLDALGKDALTVKFENLIANPDRELRRAANHVQLDYHDDMVPRQHHTLPLGSGEAFKWYPIRSNVNQRYQEEMTQEARSIVARELDGIGEKYDYKR